MEEYFLFQQVFADAGKSLVTSLTRQPEAIPVHGNFSLGQVDRILREAGCGKIGHRVRFCLMVACRLAECERQRAVDSRRLDRAALAMADQAMAKGGAGVGMSGKVEVGGAYGKFEIARVFHPLDEGWRREIHDAFLIVMPLPMPMSRCYRETFVAGIRFHTDHVFHVWNSSLEVGAVSALRWLPMIAIAAACRSGVSVATASSGTQSA